MIMVMVMIMVMIMFMFMKFYEFIYNGHILKLSSEYYFL